MFLFTLRAQKDNSTSQQKRLSNSSMWIHTPGAQYSLWRMNNFVSPEVRARDLFFWREEKNLYKMLLELCIVQHALMKSVFTFQPAKIPVSTTVKSAQLALKCWLLFLRTKNQHLCCLVVMLHNALQKKTSRDHEKKTISNLKKFFRQSQSSKTKPEPKRAKIFPFVAKLCQLPIGWYS